MKYNVNPGKKPAIAACGKIFLRLPLRTHFVKIGEALPPVLEQYARPQLQPGDILCVCEKIVAGGLSQGYPPRFLGKAAQPLRPSDVGRGGGGRAL